MPAKTNERQFTPFSRITTAEVTAAIKAARNDAIQAMLTLWVGDAAWLGQRRGAFRTGEFCVLPTDPVGMAVAVTQGSCLVNDGELHNGDWFLLYTDGGATASIPASTHPTLDRYDIICIAPKWTSTGTAVREVVDSNGNVSQFTDTSILEADFDLVVLQGTNGATKPTTSRQLAYQLAPAGLIPIAIVRVQGGSTTVELDDIDDLREIFVPRTLPVNDVLLEAAVKQQVEYVLPPVNPGMTTILEPGGDASKVPAPSLFLDLTDGEPGVLKFKPRQDTVLTVSVE